MAPTWRPVKIRASPPRNRWRSNSHAGRGFLPRARVDSARPHTTDAVARAQATIPEARAAYHVTCGLTGSRSPQGRGRPRLGEPVKSEARIGRTPVVHQ